MKIHLCQVGMEHCIPINTVLHLTLVLLLLRNVTLFHLAVAATIVNFIYTVAVKRCNFEIYSAKFDNIPHTKAMDLVFRAEVPEHLVYGGFFSYNQPHRPF